MTGYIPTHFSFFENTLPHHAQTQGNPLHDMTVSCHTKHCPRFRHDKKRASPLTLNSGCFGVGSACQYARAIEFMNYLCSYNFYLCFLFIKEIICAFYQRLKFEVFDKHKHKCFS